MKILVLCSGGLKSAFLMSLAKREAGKEKVLLLFIDHGQKNLLQEKKAAHNLSDHYKLPLQELVLTNFTDWQPFKRTLLLWYAFLMAQQERCSMVYYGASRDDCSAETTEVFIQYMKPLLDCCQNGSNRVIEIEAPLLLLNMSKIIYLSSYYDVPLKQTYSCEEGHAVHCGSCLHCKRRKEAFYQLQLEDPIVYKTKERQLKNEQIPETEKEETHPDGFLHSGNVSDAFSSISDRLPIKKFERLNPKLKQILQPKQLSVAKKMGYFS